MPTLLLLFLCAARLSSAAVLLSDARVHPQTGDVVGTEVTVEILADDRVVGTLRHFEGSCAAETVHLTGTIKGGALSASGTLRGSAVHLEGKLTKKQFDGRMLVELSRQTNTVRLRLPIVKAHTVCR